MKRKFALMLVFVMITCFGLAGCGDNPTQSDKAETSVSSSQEGDVSSQQEGSSSSQQNGGSESAPDLGEHTNTLYVEDDKDFVILNLTDFQLHDGKSTSTAFSIIDELVEKANPDLITVLGDTAEDDGTYGTMVNFKAICDHINAFNIPWAPVFGNHDNEAYREPGSVKDSDNQWIINTFLSESNCLFKVGPDTANGNGNYIINVVEKNSGKVRKALYFFDTGTLGVDSTHVSFYSDAVSYCKALNGGVTPESICFMHIPLPEYMTVYSSGEFSGLAGETPSVGSGTTDFFAKIKELGSTKHVICGHDHVNSFYANYQGVYLMYCIKSSDGDYYDPIQLGGTTFRIGALTTFEYHYVDASFELTNSTDFKLEHLSGWKYSGATLCFDVKPTDTLTASNVVSFSLCGDNLRRESVSEKDRNGEWNRLSDIITLDLSAMTASCGTFTAKEDGMYTYKLPLLDVPLNTAGGEVAYGVETLKMIYFNSVGHSFEYKKAYYEFEAVTETDQKDLSGASIAAIPEQTYTGTPVYPDLTVTYEDKELVFGEDYLVKYVDNDDAGTATVRIIPSGLGARKWKGEKTATFTIVAAGYLIRGNKFSSGSNYTLDFTEGNYSVITFEYMIVKGTSFGLVFLSGDWQKGYGYFYFNKNGAAEQYDGVSTEVLADSYIRVTIRIDDVTLTFNDKPEGLSVFFIRGDFNNADGYVDNLNCI